MRSRNDCCRRKEISITYFKCVYVALFIQHAKRINPIILLYNIFRHYLMIFGKKGYCKDNRCVLILSVTFVVNAVMNLLVP